jgi:primase-polymerase (primpol)-like protein
MKRRVLADQFGKQQRWVCWRYETVKGKKTKIPYHPNGKKASSTDKKTWVDYATAAASANSNDHFDGVGLVFTPSQTLFGIDIDHCVTGSEVTHPLKKQIEKLIAEADTYCELSPSKEGLHLFFQLEEAYTPKVNKKTPYEMYTKGRYFTVTNVPFGETKIVRTVSIDTLEALLSIIEYPWNKDVLDTKNIPTAFATKFFDGLDDRHVLEKMFASKNGDAIKQLYDGAISDYGDDASKGDMAMCSHLAFWCRRDKEQMQRLWMGSPLGSREKTQKRLDYRSRTLDNAIKGCKEIYTPPLQSSSTLDLLYTLDGQRKKQYTQNTENMCRILRKLPDFAGRFRYDLFKNVYEIQDLKTNEWRDIHDTDAIDLQTRVSVLFPVFQKVGKEMMYDAIMKVSKEYEFDSAKDFVKSIVWDGTPRLDSWLSHVYGAPDDIYHRAVGSNWLKGLVKRIIVPGCKFDYVLVLEGRQGSKKSTSLSILGGAWHVETTMSTDTKDFFMQFQGKAIIEFSEGETLSRTEVKRMKAIITMQSDKFRPPYGHVSMDFPRRCVFAMTTNQEEYLKDETGNRRWLPVKVMLPQADTQWLSDNRDQLFAEAYERVINKNETVYEFPEAETVAEQHKRRIEDPNLDAVTDWYYSNLTANMRADGITTFQVYRDAMHNGFAPRPMTKYEEMTIADMLRNFLNLERRRVMVDNKRAWKWFNNRDVAVPDSVPSSLAF